MLQPSKRLSGEQSPRNSSTVVAVVFPVRTARAVIAVPNLSIPDNGRLNGWSVEAIRIISVSVLRWKNLPNDHGRDEK